MRALDLFCGGGGAAAGLMKAGFEVVGVDIVAKHAKAYPGMFIQGDACHPPVRLADFDMVWASPPCQAFSTATPKAKKKDHPNLIGAVRSLLSLHPFTVIENVPSAPICKDLVLTGPMVGLSRIMRKRFFECSFLILQPPIQYLPPDAWERGEAVTITTSMSAPSHYYHRVALGLPGRVGKAEAMEAMGIQHDMTIRQIGEAVPPAYAEFIGRQVARILRENNDPR